MGKHTHILSCSSRRLATAGSAPSFLLVFYLFSVFFLVFLFFSILVSGIVLTVSVHVYAQARGKRENVENADRACVFFVFFVSLRF